MFIERIIERCLTIENIADSRSAFITWNRTRDGGLVRHVILVIARQNIRRLLIITVVDIKQITISRTIEGNRRTGVVDIDFLIGDLRLFLVRGRKAVETVVFIDGIDTIVNR